MAAVPGHLPGGLLRRKAADGEGRAVAGPEDQGADRPLGSPAPRSSGSSSGPRGRAPRGRGAPRSAARAVGPRAGAGGARRSARRGRAPSSGRGAPGVARKLLSRRVKARCQPLAMPRADLVGHEDRLPDQRSVGEDPDRLVDAPVEQHPRRTSADCSRLGRAGEAGGQRQLGHRPGRRGRPAPGSAPCAAAAACLCEGGPMAPPWGIPDRRCRRPVSAAPGGAVNPQPGRFAAKASPPGGMSELLGSDAPRWAEERPGRNSVRPARLRQREGHGSGGDATAEHLVDVLLRLHLLDAFMAATSRAMRSSAAS